MLNRILFISNVCFEPHLRTYIKSSLSFLSCDAQFDFVTYDESRDNTSRIKKSDIVVVCLNFEAFYPNLSIDISSEKVVYEDIEKDCIQKCKDLHLLIKENTSAHIIWFGFEDYYCLQNNFNGLLVAFDGLVDRINLIIKDILLTDSFVDFKRLIATVGIERSYDLKSRYRWNAPYSKDLICLIAEEVRKQYLIFSGITKKCIVLDCDNVLWGGVVSEDGIEGIHISNSGLGREFQDFQRYLLDLYYHGVILTVCSKNDWVDVLRVFREHTGMLLREEHIADFQCNWNNKSDNIKDIVNRLNIGIESVVFVDDSVFEVESVKNSLPNITAILYKRESIYQELSCFNLKQNTDIQIIKERTNTYKTNIMRDELKKTVASYDEYLSSLRMVIDIHKTNADELARISELTQRTNRCTNGTRYTLEQLKARMNSERYELYTVYLFDRFSDLGVVGVMGMSEQCVDLFSLSCRVLGRNVEKKMTRWLQERGAESIRFTSTDKNDTLHNLFLASGFKIMN